MYCRAFRSARRALGPGPDGPGGITGGGHFGAKTVEKLILERFDRRFPLYCRSFEKAHVQKHKVFD